MTRHRDLPELDYTPVFDAIPTPMLILNADLIIVGMNSAYLALSGTTRSQLLGRTPMEMFPGNPEDPADTGVTNLTRSLQTVLATGRPDTMALQRYDVQRAPGAPFEKRYWSPVNIPVYVDGEVAYIIHRVEEVTEYILLRGAQKQATAELRTRTGRLEADLIARAGEIQVANRQLREVNEQLTEATRALRDQQQAKDRFIATLSHELRNPLAAIRAAIDLLSLDLPAGHSALDVLDRQVSALVRMTDDLLDASRALTGRLTVTRQPLDLREVVETVTSDLRAHFTRGERTLTVATPAEPVPVAGDRVRLAQLLGNLLSNAFAYTSPGGTVSVELTSGDGHALLSVADDGAGFDPTDAESLFEVFTRAVPSGAGRAAHGPGVPTAGGLGLGLGLVRSIAGLHGGTATAHSQGPGTGAEFRVRLPLGEVPPPGGHAPAPAGATRRGALRVLVVEDNPDLAASYRELLARRGDRVTVARTGADGLAAARQRQFDLVLCDIGLPDMDGRQLARRLRHHPQRGRMRLVAVSGFGQPADQQASRAAGFDAHLVKPVTLADLDASLAGGQPG
jgi:signal transduction histidine kinase